MIHVKHNYTLIQEAISIVKSVLAKKKTYVADLVISNVLWIESKIWLCHTCHELGVI